MSLRNLPESGNGQWDEGLTAAEDMGICHWLKQRLALEWTAVHYLKDAMFSRFTEINPLSCLQARNCLQHSSEGKIGKPAIMQSAEHLVPLSGIDGAALEFERALTQETLRAQ
jgi:hypothetical protein